MMQPVLAIGAGAAVFASTVWFVYRMLRAFFPNASPNLLGAVLIAAAIWLLFFRLFVVSLALFLFGIVLNMSRNDTKSQSAPAQKSRVRSAHLEMTLDHETGDIDGRIISGSRDGQSLSDMALSDLLQLLSEIQSDDQSLKLLETYLDRTHPDWHDHAASRAQDHSNPPPKASDMTREDAYRVLGLEPGSSEDEIRDAFRRLIKKLHPDSGGSAALTAQITAARDRLLGDP